MDREDTSEQICLKGSNRFVLIGIIVLFIIVLAYFSYKAGSKRRERFTCKDKWSLLALYEAIGLASAGGLRSADHPSEKVLRSAIGSNADDLNPYHDRINS